MDGLERRRWSAYLGGMLRQAHRIAVPLTLAALLAGGAYLYAVRGTAILLDLSTMVRGLLCL